MKICRINCKSGSQASGRGFTLIEPVIGLAILVLLIIAFYGGVAQGIFTMRMAREDQRATQIMLQKTETIRMCTWQQITNGSIPKNFTTTYTPGGTAHGITYTGSIDIANAPVSAPYSNNLKVVTVNLDWTTGGIKRQRQMRTLVSRWGLNNYVN
jgi:Tfp pilus assembly protein PilV